jgi:hypothetical protein
MFFLSRLNRRHGVVTFVGLALAIGGCALASSDGTAAAKDRPAPVDESQEQSPGGAGTVDEAALGLPVLPTDDERVKGPVKSTVISTPFGDLDIKYRNVDGLNLAEGDIVVPVGPNDTKSATSVGRQWDNGVVPYVIDSNLPLPERVTQAIAHWEAKTKLRFVPRTMERDYVHFRSSSGCSSYIGNIGGRQFINLTTSEAASTVQAIGIDRSVRPQRTYFFYKRGFATSGSVRTANLYSNHFRYIVAPGRGVANLIDVAFANNGRLFSWYDDGTVSEGTPQDFAFYSNGRAFSPAPGKTIADVAGVAIDVNNQVFAFYKDGTYSQGNPTDFAAANGSQPFTVAEGKTPADIAHVDADADGVFHTFYNEMNPGVDGGAPTIRSLQSSMGTANKLASASGTALTRTSFMGHCPVGATIHEIGHAVGLFHEQTRHDRNDYVKIMWDNIGRDEWFNFEKHSRIVGTDTGTYDFGSIMHYGPTAFTINGQPTIVPVAGGTFTEQRDGLSDIDVEGVRAMYGN